MNVTFKHYNIKVILALMIVVVSACSSPEDKANKFFENGMAFLEKGLLKKANIEFKNALQINRKMTKAIWGQVLVAEKKNKPRQQYKLLNAVLINEPENLQALVKLGRLLLLAGQLDKALEKSDVSMKVDNHDLSVLSLRAAVMLKLNDKTAAVSLAKQVLTKDPFYVDAIMILATERLASDDAKRAIEYLDQGLKKDSKNIALQLIKIKALEKLARLDSAEDVFKRLIIFYPKVSAFNEALAQFYVKHGKKENAEKIYRTVVVNNPENLKFKIKLVHFIKAVKGEGAALKQLKIFSLQDPGNTKLQFAEVQFYFSSKKNSLANKLLAKIINENEGSEIAIKAKGIMAVSLLSKNDIKAAEKIINEILIIDKENENGLILKANLNIKHKKYDEAIRNLRVVLRNAPNSSRALFFLARSHALSGAYALADKKYFEAFKSSKFDSSYGLSYAGFLLKRKQYRRAEKIIQDVLSVSQNNLPALKLLAKTRLTLGDWIGAQEVSDNIKRMGVKGNIVNQINSAVLVGKKDYDESISLLKKIYQATPGEDQPIVALVKTYLLAGKKQEAGNFIDAVISASPKNINARILRGQIHSLQGETEKAINIFKKVISSSPLYDESYYHLAVIYIRDKKYKNALEILTKGINVSPKSFPLGLTRAQIYEVTGQTDKAINAYEKIFKIKPDANIAANNLASLLMENRTDSSSLKEAYNLSKRFKVTDVPQFKDTFGWASYHVGKYSEAEILFKNAIEQLPGVPDFHYHLGMNYLAKGNKKLARVELEKSLKLSEETSFVKVDEVRATLEKI